jgi:hypothetical protein
MTARGNVLPKEAPMSWKPLLVILTGAASFLPFVFLVHLPGPYWLGTIVWGVLLCCTVALFRNDRRVWAVALTAPVALFPGKLSALFFHLIVSFVGFAP